MDIESGLQRARGVPREFGDRIDRLREWRRNLTTELSALPDTLQTLRQGATNFEVVSRRLAESSDGLEQATKLYEATVADSTRRSADAATVLRSQIEALASAGSPERVLSGLREVQRAVEALAELNPLWPGTRRDAE